MVVCLVHLLEALGPERWSVRRPSQRVDQDIISMQVIGDLEVTDTMSGIAEKGEIVQKRRKQIKASWGSEKTFGKDRGCKII